MHLNHLSEWPCVDIDDAAGKRMRAGVRVGLQGLGATVPTTLNLATPNRTPRCNSAYQRWYLRRCASSSPHGDALDERLVLPP